MINLREIYSRHRICALWSVEFSIGHLENGLELYDLHDDPPYQRGHVWTDEQQTAFVGHFLTGGAVGPIIWNATTDDLEGGPLHVVDGKQRLRALLRWLHDEIPADIEGARVFRRDCEPRLPLDARVKFWIVRLSEADVLRLYLRLNRGGTPHTSEEIARVERMLATLEAR